jgi:hypothetical protein
MIKPGIERPFFTIKRHHLYPQMAVIKTKRLQVRIRLRKKTPLVFATSRKRVVDGELRNYGALLHRLKRCTKKEDTDNFRHGMVS